MISDGMRCTLKSPHSQQPPVHPSRAERPQRQGIIPGTQAYLDRLEAHLDGSTILNWTERYAELQPAYA
jgi:hypothetical protein